VVVVAAWQMSGGGGSSPPAKRATTTTAGGGVPPLLTVRAIRGSAHVTAHRGSNVTGNLAFDGTVSQGDPPVGIRGSRLWVYISTPENLRILVRGRLVHVPGSQPRTILVTATGWRPL
jgi:hypothetical protein